MLIYLNRHFLLKSDEYNPSQENSKILIPFLFLGSHSNIYQPEPDNNIHILKITRAEKNHTYNEQNHILEAKVIRVSRSLSEVLHCEHDVCEVVNLLEILRVWLYFPWFFMVLKKDETLN